MKKTNHVRSAAAALLVTALLFSLALSACGGSKAAPAPTEAPTAAPTEAPTAAPTEAPTAAPTEAPTPEPTDTPEPEPTEVPGPTATPVAAGTYVWSSENGDWKLQLKDSGLFTLIDPDGGMHTGEGWETGPDGVVTCGPTDIYFESFAFNGGCSRWIVEGKACRPVMP